MIKKILLAFVALSLGAASLIYMEWQALKNRPEFTIVNNTDFPISFVAKWRDSKISTDNLRAKSAMTFLIRDEASMEFIIEYKSGKTENKNIGYFTSGSSCHIEVHEASIESSCFF
jgi:hypothetical protein